MEKKLPVPRPYDKGLVAIEQALNSIEGLIPRQGAEEKLQSLAARIDVVRFQLYVINETLAGVLHSGERDD